MELVDDGHAARPALKRLDRLLSARVEIPERQARVQQVNAGGDAQARGPWRRLWSCDWHPPQAINKGHGNERQVSGHFRAAGSVAMYRTLRGRHGRYASITHDICHV